MENEITEKERKIILRKSGIGNSRNFSVNKIATKQNKKKIRERQRWQEQLNIENERIQENHVREA